MLIFADHNEHMYLLVADGYSKWPAVVCVLFDKQFCFSHYYGDISSMFAAYGLLKEIGLDKRHLVKHSRSAAYHSASDGSAGHLVQTLKRAVKKNEE